MVSLMTENLSKKTTNDNDANDRDFTLRPAGIKDFVMPDGSQAKLYFFTLHDTTPEQNMFVHMVDDIAVPVTIQSYPVIEAMFKKTGPRLLVPDTKRNLLH